jgi:hypothetical protein
VGDRSGELLHGARVLAFELLALARELRMDALLDLFAQEALAHARLEDELVEAPHVTRSPDDQHDDPDGGKKEQEQQRDDAELDQVAGELDLALGLQVGLVQGALFRAQELQIDLVQPLRIAPGAIATALAVSALLPLVPVVAHEEVSREALAGTSMVSVVDVHESRSPQPRPACFGMVIVNSAPSPGDDVASMDPPWASTTFLEIARPRPVPESLEV